MVGRSFPPPRLLPARKVADSIWGCNYRWQIGLLMGVARKYFFRENAFRYLKFILCRQLPAADCTLSARHFGVSQQGSLWERHRGSERSRFEQLLASSQRRFELPKHESVAVAAGEVELDY